jgi:hypothetical protein
MMNPNDNNEANASDTHPTFGFKLKLLSFYLFMFNSCLNMNTCTCLVSLTIIIMSKYLFNYRIKICRDTHTHATFTSEV